MHFVDYKMNAYENYIEILFLMYQFAKIKYLVTHCSGEGRKGAISVPPGRAGPTPGWSGWAVGWELGVGPSLESPVQWGTAGTDVGRGAAGTQEHSECQLRLQHPQIPVLGCALATLSAKQASVILPGTSMRKVCLAFQENNNRLGQKPLTNKDVTLFYVAFKVSLHVLVMERVSGDPKGTVGERLRQSLNSVLRGSQKENLKYRLLLHPMNYFLSPHF